MTKTTRNNRRFSKTLFIRSNAVRIGLLTPQARTVLDHLLTTNGITQREAIMDHSVQSLTKRISELRDAGFDIGGEWKKHPISNQRYMSYSYAPGN